MAFQQRVGAADRGNRPPAKIVSQLITRKDRAKCSRAKAEQSRIRYHGAINLSWAPVGRIDPVHEHPAPARLPAADPADRRQSGDEYCAQSAPSPKVGALQLGPLEKLPTKR